MEDKVIGKKYKVSFVVETNNSNWMKKDKKTIEETTKTMLDEFFEINDYSIKEIKGGNNGN